MIRSKLFALLIPILLLESMLPIFRLGTALFGREAGYLLGFAVYWAVWCIGAPIALLGWGGFMSIWRERSPLFARGNWPAALVFVIITGVTVGMYAAEFSRARLILILVAIPAAVLNGICEELLWRGLYMSAFPNSPWLGILYPALGFALWHLAPLQIFPAAGGWFPFVVSTFFLGLAYGFIAYRNGSARWTALSHSLNGILALSGMLAPSILSLFGK